MKYIKRENLFFDLCWLTLGAGLTVIGVTLVAKDVMSQVLKDVFGGAFPDICD